MKNQFLNFKGFLALALGALMLGVTGCKDPETPTLPQLTIGYNGTDYDGNIPASAVATVAAEGANLTVTVSATRDWTVTSNADWVVPSPASGGEVAGKAINIEVEANTDVARGPATVTFKLNDGTLARTMTISQAGEEVPPIVGDITISDIRAMYSGTDVTIADDKTLIATVINDSSDQGGNSTSLRNIIISDADAGITVRLAENSTYSKGDELSIKVKDLLVSHYGGAVQLTQGSAGVPTASVTKTGNTRAVEAVSITAAQLVSGDFESRYVAVGDVQFVAADAGQPIAGTSHKSSGMQSRTGESFSAFVASYATFKANNNPEGSGVIKGIAGVNNGNIQIQPQTYADYAGLTGARFELEEPPFSGTFVSISELRAMFTGSNVTIDRDIAVKGSVIVDFDQNNVASLKNLMISDGTAGIAIRLANDVTPADLPVNTEVQIVLTGMGLSAYQGLVQLSATNDKIVKTGNTVPISPVEITASEFNSGDYQSMLVKIKDVQFVASDAGKNVNDASLTGSTYSLSKMEDAAGNEFPVYVSSYCKFFASQVIPAGSGSIIGVGTISGNPTVKQLMPRYTTDYDGLTGDRFAGTITFEVGAPNPTTVAAAGGDATVAVTTGENVAWTATVTAGSGGTITGGATGTGNGTVTVNFPANADTENGRSVTVTIATTDATVTGTKTHDVVFTQANAIASNTSVETFSNHTSTNNSYTSASATGTYESTEVAGLVWSYAGTAHNQGSGAGKAKFIIGRYNGSNANPASLTTSTIATGVGSISIDWTTPFNDTSTGTSFKVFVNDVEKGTFLNEAGTSNQTGTFTIDNVNVSGNAVIKIASNEKGRPGINKITWTAYSN